MGGMDHGQKAAQPYIEMHVGSVLVSLSNCFQIGVPGILRNFC